MSHEVVITLREETDGSWSADARIDGDLVAEASRPNVHAALSATTLLLYGQEDWLAGEGPIYERLGESAKIA